MAPLMMINVLCSGVCTVNVFGRQTSRVHFSLFAGADVESVETWHIL